MLYEIYQHYGMNQIRTIHTIRHFRHQGVTGGEVLAATGLQDARIHFFSRDRLPDIARPNALNFARGGIVYSNFVTTVSRHPRGRCDTPTRAAASRGSFTSHQG